MHSEIAAKLSLSYHPVALLWADEKPEENIPGSLLYREIWQALSRM